MGNLGHDSGAVAGTGVGTHSPSVLKISQCVESSVYDVVACVPAHRGYERESARVFVVGRIEETDCFGHGGEAMVRRKKIHDASPRK
jgi:hypothetical protein